MKLTDKQKSELEYELHHLDWIRILNEAVRNRPTSWGCHDPKCFVIKEWRNASDEILYALLRELRKKKIIKEIGKSN